MRYCLGGSECRSQRLCYQHDQRGIDIDGYFTTPGADTLQFYALTPCRVLDTRKLNGPLGGPYLPSGQERDFPVLESACNIPSTAQAYSMNFTVVPYEGQVLGYLTVWRKVVPGRRSRR